MAPNHLHVGASSLELLNRTPTREFINPSWIHLGDPPHYDARSDTGTLKSRMRRHAKHFFLHFHRQALSPNADLYKKTTFLPWMFRHGDTLDIADEAISFAYTEHVFEHFRYDVAVELLAEIYRVLMPGGRIRIVVPDADYRTYEDAEPAGYPSKKIKMDHPNKHKTRWNVYLLSYTLKSVGFGIRPVVWCSDDGMLHEDIPARDGVAVEPDLVSSLQYVQRPKSLIVDGIKPAA